MVDLIKDVEDFHLKFDLPFPDRPRLLPKDLFNFRADFLLEEVHETIEAHSAGDLPGFADGLVDLTYVAIGTAIMAGLPFRMCWKAVQAANMAKVRAQSADQSKRSSSYDVIKPPGWVPPDIKKIIEEASCPMNGIGAI